MAPPPGKKIEPPLKPARIPALDDRPTPVGKARRGPWAVVASVLKVIALVAGLAGSVVCLASLVGLVTENGWVRLGVALLVALIVPAVLTDRLLPKDESQRAPGLPSDVFALTWLAIPVVYAVLLSPVTNAALVREGDRLAAVGATSLARLAYLLTDVTVSFPAAVPPVGSATPSASVAAGGKGEHPAKPTPSASAPPSASSAPEGPEDAGVSDATAGSDRDRSPAELFKELSPAVVAIAQLEGEHATGGGTGFVIDKRGTIVTNFHVIDAAKALRIKFINGAIYEDVDLLTDSAPADLALLRVEVKKPKSGEVPVYEPATLGDSEAVVVGERAIAIGNPLGLEHTLTDGLVSSRRKYQGKNWIQVSVPVSPGNSGGPLFNLRGEVIGVTTAQIGALFGQAQNLNLAVPVNELRALLRDEYPGRRKFGSGDSPSTW